MKENIIQRKTENFAYRMIDLCKVLRTDFKEYEISRQLIRSGTSIGANVVEAQNAISKKDFLLKMYISLKECGETLYWLRLLHHGKYVMTDNFESLYADCEEIRKILIAIIKKTKINMNRDVDL
ncbi:four helix bundle protein [Dialister sp.]|uniref:four helix bundle protein n=1 Tax=Dialister sp. TaxID=1955814 RepID=UPI003F0327E2